MGHQYSVCKYSVFSLFYIFAISRVYIFSALQKVKAMRNEYTTKTSCAGAKGSPKSLSGLLRPPGVMGS